MSDQNQNTWQQLADVPFVYGVSAGGGLATDGTYIYAADFSGDADDDFIDLDGDLVDDPEERLDALGIGNGSVRFARYNPVTNTWESLPMLNAIAPSGDAFSAGNLTNPLFVAGNKLYYYQFRSGPNIRALYSYDLSSGTSAEWQLIWQKTDENSPLIQANAGIEGIDVNGEPAIIHNLGGGAYEFARTDNIASGGTHTQLTPNWNFNAAHFPRNGAWEYDPASDRIFHLSGNQLLMWQHNNTAYPGGNFLNSTPDGINPLALETTLIDSLEEDLGWDTGSSEVNPGTSLWGNSLTLVNDGLYLLRGETSTDTWPFNEGRGLINNGNFARVFPNSGLVETLPNVPFNIGKGSTAVSLNGYLYVTQGDTLTLGDDPGNAGTLQWEGIRQPGKGFARFKIDANSGPIGVVPNGELTEGNANLWSTFASDGAIATVNNDTNLVRIGEQSLKFDTQSGFDTGITYTPPTNTYLDLSTKNHLVFWAYGINNNPNGFQGNQPIIQLNSATGSFRYEPQGTFMSNNGWQKYTIPLEGNSQWVRTTTGTPTLSNITELEIHQDTWDAGFTVYYDGLEFINRDPNYLPPAGPTPPPGVNPNAIAPKVLLYVFDPIMENLGGVRQHQAYGWGDPVTLTNQVVNDLKTNSHGLVNYQVVDVKIADQHPYYKDGFQYTDEGSHQAWLNRDFSRSNVGFDYVRFVNENNIAQRVESGEIDEVWLYSGPLGGMYESVMAGNGAYWINGEVQNVDSDRAFAIMGWNFERGVGEALHSFGHRAEGIMDHIYGVQSPNQDNNWNKFTFQDRYQPGLGGVGNIHFPVNGTSDYDYANENFVISNADDWYNYPNFTGTTRSFNFREWSPNGTDPQREYLNWWYNHLPHFGGRGNDYYLNNWWRYITDVDQFKFSKGNLYLTDGIPTVKIGNVVNQPNKGVVDVVANAWVDGALGRVDLYLDNAYFASDTLSPYTFSLTLNNLTGTHTLLAKAYELQNGTEAVSAPVNLAKISSTLPATVNQLYLIGTVNINGSGNANNNTIVGNSGNNTLDGKAGNDTMQGGVGNDTYVVDSAADVVTENLNSGTDTVRSSIDYILGANLENLILLGADHLKGTGNSLNNRITGNGGNNILEGGGGNDILDGQAGSDTMQGGVGNDTYVVNSSADVVIENLNEGTDTVRSSIDYILGANLENLILLGADNLKGTGNSLNNRITGNSGNNILEGKAGNDVLSGGLGNDTLVGGGGNDNHTGGKGADRFSFNSVNEGIDRITDFVPVDDTIVVSAAGFGGGLIAGAAIAAEQFTIGTSATTANHRFIYNQTNGRLFFDQDGTGLSFAPVHIATLSSGLALTNSDILVAV